MSVCHEQFGVQLVNYTPSMTSCSYVCVVDDEVELWPPSSSIGLSCGRGEGGSGTGSQVFTASMLTVWLIS